MTLHAQTLSHAPQSQSPEPGRISLLRLHALRASYLLLVVGLGLVVWPGIIHHDLPWGLDHGVMRCMLAALPVVAFFGVKYPLQMLPVLLFEVAWKAIWLTAVALPAWSAHTMDADTAQTASECLMAIIFVVVIPWRYVWANYVLRDGDRWR